jgi:D-serine deaminase-like pyridoxal phosphate-dependent protein
MVVDLETFEKNLNTMADHCRKAGLQLRGHVKVHKSPEIARRQAALGSIGVTCATVAECELMADSGIKGVLLTRQPTSKNNIGRTVALARREPTFGTVVDDPASRRMVAGGGGQRRRYGQDSRRRLCGPHPSWNRAGGPAIELAKKVDSSKNLKLIGLMGYSGGASHTKGWNERKKKSQDDLDWTAGKRGHGACGRFAGQHCHRREHGNVQHRQRVQSLTELQAGSFVFMDTLYPSDRR